MKNKLTITKDNYKEIMLKRAIIICWVLLIICFIVKICGGNFFNISCDNERFVNLCSLIDKSFIRYILYYISYMFICFMLLYISSPLMDNKKKIIIYFVLSSLLWIFKLVYEIYLYEKLNAIIYDIIILLFTYLNIYIASKKIIMPIITIGLDFIFTFISSITKNVALNGIITDSFLVTIIFMIDYYIMLVLAVLYMKLRKRRIK